MGAHTRTSKSWLQATETSEGLSTHTLPAASAPTTGISESMKGKFQGAMTVTTPNGSFQAWSVVSCPPCRGGEWGLGGARRVGAGAAPLSRKDD